MAVHDRYSLFMAVARKGVKSLAVVPDWAREAESSLATYSYL